MRYNNNLGPTCFDNFINMLVNTMLLHAGRQSHICHSEKNIYFLIMMTQLVKY